MSENDSCTEEVRATRAGEAGTSDTGFVLYIEGYWQEKQTRASHVCLTIGETNDETLEDVEWQDPGLSTNTYSIYIKDPDVSTTVHKISADYRAIVKGEVVWDVVFTTSSDEKELELKWDASSIDGYELIMDFGDTEIDMIANSSYTLTETVNFQIKAKPSQQPVTGVALNQSSAELTVGGEAVQLTATVSPEDADDKSVTWTSSDPAVATVVDGLVTAVSKGSATITVATTDGGYTATCAVTVKQPVASVALNQSAVELKVGGEAVQLTATVAPENASDKSVSWSTSDSAVATISNTGLVTPVAKGTATITVTTTDGGYTATCDVTVIQPVTSVALNQRAINLTVGGEAMQLTATVSPEDADDKSVTWSSSNAAVATVSDSGLVSPVAKGNATITVTTTDGDFTATCDVTVTQPVTSVALNQSAINLTVGGESMQLTATVSPEDADDKSVTWSSSDPAVATVVDGLVTAVAKGSATITVTTTDGSFTATCDVTVKYPVNTLFLKAGWNLVAFRMHPKKSNQFNGITFYQHWDEQYVTVEDFAKNIAYWAFSADDKVIIYNADDFDSDKEPVLTNEWQFVGISDEIQIDRGSIVCFEWLDGAFREVDESKALEVGRGYLMRKRE